MEQTLSPNSAASQATSERITWYRSPVDKELLASLQQRSDAKGWLQCVSYAGFFVVLGGLALWSVGNWPWWATLALTFFHGSFYGLMSSAVHELIHRTVFKTKWLNDACARFFSFFSGMSCETFHPSHMKHHQWTLHAPEDLEVVLPMKVPIRDFLLYGIVNPKGTWFWFRNILRIARGRFEGDWELKLFPPEAAEKRRSAVNWARITLAGHLLIIAASLFCGWAVHPRWFLLPFLTSFFAGYGGWFPMMMGAPQHMGMQDFTKDYRLCCRTYTANAFFQFLYWDMNYHIEHHMYAAVPCYNLPKLHRAIKHDLPPCPAGVIATWKQIADIQRHQQKDPNFVFEPPLPRAA